MKNDADRALFLNAVEGTLPLKTEARAATGKRPIEKRKETERKEVRDFLSDHDAFPGEETSYCRSGLSRPLKKLKRGGFPIGKQIDLHGMTTAEARTCLLHFLEEAKGMRAVRIIHGKGQGVLRSCVRNWLVQIPEVLAFSEARPEEGGSGALVVLLKT